MPMRIVLSTKVRYTAKKSDLSSVSSLLLLEAANYQAV